jgi:hypothetical protein
MAGDMNPSRIWLTVAGSMAQGRSIVAAWWRSFFEVDFRV